MRPVVLYVDPFDGGHHPEHLAFFTGVLDAAGFAVEAHVPPPLAQRAARSSGRPLPATFHDAPDLQTASLVERARFLRDVFAKARAAGARAVMFDLIDPLIWPLALMVLSNWRAPVPWSGVFFRDSFNYPEDEAAGARAKSRVKAAMLAAAVRGGAFALFTLNPFWRLKLACPVVWLPDCLSELDEIAAREAEAVGVWPLPRPDAPAGDARVRFLAFGAIQARKGVLEFLRALGGVSDDLLGRAEVRLMGRFSDSPYQVAVEAAAAALRARGARVEIEADYVPNARLDAALRGCQVIAAGYLDHVGSSGVVGIAIQYGRPVLGQATYQIGEELRAFDLGPVVAPRDTAAYARVLEGVLREPPLASPGMERARADRNISAAREAMTRAVSALHHPPLRGAKRAKARAGEPE